MMKQPESRALLLMSGGLILVGVIFYTKVEQWSVLNAVYFCVVTLGTVGYGDIVPTTDAGKIFTIFYVIVGLGIIGGFFATVGRLIVPGRFLQRGERVASGTLPFVNQTSSGEPHAEDPELKDSNE